MARDINNVEIFSTGTWNGNRRVTVTDSDLQEMVNSFNELTTQVPGFKPFLKLGHTEMQKFFGGESGAPSLGFISKVWVEGKKVLANFSNVPDALVDLISQGRYNAVSIEFLPKVKFGGTEFKNVLRAVALLGAELPAVKGLKELSASLMSEFAFEFEDADPAETFEKEYQMATNDAKFDQAQVDALIEAAVSKAVDAAKASFSDEVEALKAEVETLKEQNVNLTEGKASVEASLRDFVSAGEQKEIVALVEKAVAEGKITPAEKGKYIALAQVESTVKLGEDEVSVRSLIEDILSTAKPKVDLSEASEGETHEKDSGEGEGSAAEIVDSRSRAIVKATEGKTDYHTAYLQVLSEDPDLAARYQNLED